MTDLHTRAAKIFKAEGGAIVWPYGLSIPSFRRSGLTRERYDQKALEQRAAQLLIVEWAERYGLRESRKGCCPIWLQGKTSRRCAPGACRNYGGLDYLWLDHTVAWLKDGKPAVITSAPYTQHGAENHEIRYWLDKDDRLRVAVGAGWYGHGTTQIVMWRADRIDTVVPATPAH